MATAGVPSIGGLEAADDGDLEPLVRLFADIQRRAIYGAVSSGSAMLGTGLAEVRQRAFFTKQGKTGS